MRKMIQLLSVRLFLMAAFWGAITFWGSVFFILAVKGSPKLVSTGNVSPWKCYVPSSRYVWDFKPNCSEVFVRDGSAAELKFNSMGIRDKEYLPRTRYKNRILFIGDSALLGTGLDERVTVPRLLEASWRKKRFSVEVINGGKSGYTAVQQYLNLPALLDAYRPTGVVMLGGVAYGVLARLHYLESFVRRDEMGRPKSIAPLNFEGRWWSFLAGNWGETGLDRFLLQRQFQMQLGFFAQSWGCTLEGLLGDSSADCMLWQQVRDLVNMQKLSALRGVKFLGAFDEMNEMQVPEKGGGVMGPPLQMPLAHKILHNLTPVVNFPVSSVKRFFSQEGLSYVGYSLPPFKSEPSLYFSGWDVHLNEKGSRLLVEKLDASLSAAILVK